MIHAATMVIVAVDKFEILLVSVKFCTCVKKSYD